MHQFNDRLQSDLTRHKLRELHAEAEAQRQARQAGGRRLEFRLPRFLVRRTNAAPRSLRA